MSYQFKVDDLYSLINGMYAETITKGKEIQFKYCPYCKGGEHHDKYTFSVNTENGCYNCKRGSCGVQGHFVQLARDMNYQIPFDIPQRKYKKLRQREVIVRDEAIEYLKSRGISAETTQRYKITVGRDNSKILVFPFYDDNGEMVFIKYRKTDYQKGKDKCKEWVDTNTKPILFGMLQCDRNDTKKLVITEGQIDSLTLSECGVKNAVSVPIGKNGFTWIDNCYEFVNKFEELVIFGDCEKGQISLVEGIKKRFPQKMIKVVRVEDYLGEKDANDIYRKFGKEAIQTAVENAKVEPVRAVRDLANVSNVNLMKLEHVKTGFMQIDKVIGGLYFGQIGILTGKRGEGKSTFASQICANILNEGYSIFVYSGELTDYHFKYWLDLQIAGGDKVKEYINDYKDVEYYIPKETAEIIDEWYRGRAYIFDNTVVADEDEEEISLINTIEEAICRYGVKFILIDNLMTAIDVDVKDDLYLSQSKFVKKLKRIATKWGVFILIVAHPRKESGKELNNDSVSGSGDITNAVDIVFTYGRNEGTDREDYQSIIGVTKNRLTGRLLINQNRVKASYSSKCKRVASTIGEKTRIYKCFEEKSKPEPPAMEYDSLDDFVEILPLDVDLDAKFNAAIDKAARLYDK